MIGFEINLTANENQTLRVALISGDNNVPIKFNSVKLEDW